MSKIADGFVETLEWFSRLDASFAFLLTLPFLVVFAGFLSECFSRRRAGH